MQQIEKTQRVLPRNVPISIIKDSNHCQDSLMGIDEEGSNEALSPESSEKYIGPMPARRFVSVFLPIDPLCLDKMPSDHTKLQIVFHKDSNVKDELCKYFNTSGICPNFKLAYTPECITYSTLIRPEICLYREDTLEGAIESDGQDLGGAELFVQYKDSMTQEDPFKDPIRGTDNPEFNFIRDIYEELEDEDEDEDEDDEETEIKDTYTTNRGEIAAYAAELCARQFRTHCFSVSIYGTRVRFFRWDRAGVVISEAFDILENPEVLCRFLWNYTHASAAQRGFDTSATKASKEEEEVFEKLVRDHIKEQLAIEDSEVDSFVNEHYEPKSVYKLSIYPRLPRKKSPETMKRKQAPSVDSISKPYPWNGLWDEVVNLDTQGTVATIPDIECKTKASPDLLQSRARAYSEVQYFLVSRPVITPMKSISRGTRGYWSVKLPDASIGEMNHVIAFVKDTWREDSEDTEIEGDVIIGNVEGGVKFVSDIFCHGNVKTGAKTGGNTETSCDGPKSKNCHITQTGKYMKSKWNCNKNRRGIPSLRHYRMASVEVGYPLSSFRGTKELVHGVRCAFLALWSAYVLRRRLHRDISLNNIILVRKEQGCRIGILIDWELSSKAGKDGMAKDSARSGTWEFMSVALLRADGFKHRLQDDMESIYYVLLYASVLLLPRKEERNFHKLVSDFFNEYIDCIETTIGGALKGSNIISRSFQKIWHFDNVHLQKCLDDMLELLRPFEDQPSWAPEACYAILESTDKKDLPYDDRMDHYQIKQDKLARRRAWIEQQERSETPSVKTVSDLSASEKASSKRSISDAELEEYAEVTKRMCCPIFPSQADDGRE